MLTKGDDYPLHQSPEPMAVSGGNRNFYDRYFFNGYSADGSIFFAAALGIYPQLDIMDAAFCLTINGKQHNIRASRHMGSERLDLEVGPIRVEILEPLKSLRIIVSDNAKLNESPVTANITFTARHSPIEEPRFIRREGPRLMMDYTRLTQNGGWSGNIRIDGQDIALEPRTHRGTRESQLGYSSDRRIGIASRRPPVPSHNSGGCGRRSTSTITPASSTAMMMVRVFHGTGGALLIRLPVGPPNLNHNNLISAITAGQGV